jgi:serine/threonine protein phosphatase PrpC
LELTIEKDAVDVRDGDVFLLCTDGFWECVLESEMEATLSKASSVANWLRAMEEYVIERGSAMQDNYSAIGIFCTNRNEHTFPGSRLDK